MSSSLGAQKTPGCLWSPPNLALFVMCGLLGANPEAAEEARDLASPRLFVQPQPFRDRGGLGVPAIPTPRPEGQPAVPPAPKLSTREQACHATGRAGSCPLGMLKRSSISPVGLSSLKLVAPRHRAFPAQRVARAYGHRVPCSSRQQGPT